MLRTTKDRVLAALKSRKTYVKAEKLVIIALVVATLARIFVAQPFVVSGDSMEPTYDSGDYLVIDRIAYQFKTPQRGDVIVFRYPLDPSVYFIKRIDALPGETVEESTGELVASSSRSSKNKFSSVETAPGTLTLAPDEYFVLGDNSAASSDSRLWGPLQRKFIVGRVVTRVWPLFGG